MNKETEAITPIGGPLNNRSNGSRIFVPDAPLVLTHPNALEPGDRIKIGKRIWLYQGRCEELTPGFTGQNEYVFTSPEGDDGPGEIGPVKRIYSQSEIEALAANGMVERQKWCRVNFDANKVTYRGETA